MKVLITQSNYIPWKGYFDAINKADVFVLYDDMQYTKRDWRNRNLIKTAKGLQWLTIPVQVKGKYFQKINETIVSEKDWNKSHWDQIRNAYRQAPYFKTYQSFFEDLYKSSNEEYLSKINHSFLSSICGLLGISTKFMWSHEFELKGDKSEKLLNIWRELNATHYISGPAAKDYLDESLFKAENITVEWMEYNYNEYPQQFPPFQHGVSIIDLLFNCGDRFKEHMNSF